MAGDETRRHFRISEIREAKKPDIGRLEMPVRTTVVGSWWLHPEMEEDLARHHAGKCSAHESEAILNRAATKAIKEQRELGLDEWTGGEYHTDNFILHIHKMMTGFEIDKPQADDVFDYDDMTHAKIV